MFRLRNFDPSTWSFASSLRRHEPRPHRWPPFRDDGGDEVLRVLKSDLKFAENGSLHRTDKYDLMIRQTDPHLVVRRGQDFTVEISFNRPFVKEKDGVSILFSVHDGKPSLNHGTLVIVPLIDRPIGYESPNEWHAYIRAVNGRRVLVQIKTSSRCSVGKWKIAVDTKLKSSQSAVSYTLPKPIYVLFNPWNSEDDVFLVGDDSREEYILEDSGLIWRGSHNRLRPAPWAYSQFEQNVLECGLSVISKHMKPSMRGDAVKTVRALAALVNSPDDGGILEGNWSDDFSGGTAPSKWTGSAKILQQYHDTQKTVKFGQCWVFAGVLTTICRAIGIPCRPVTNFSSAHDTQSSLTVDYFVDQEGKPVEHMNTDSIWNFHVWCEVWMKREDMGDERYWGWQVIDSTPQEQSDGVYQMGPASVEACRRGEIKRSYDVDFLFSEVNADKVYWRYLGATQPLKLLSKKPNRDAVGLNISTKAIGKFAREDITFSYKYPEKSSEERDAMLNALKQRSPFRVVLLIENVSEEEEFDVKGFIRVDSQLYTGKRKDLVTKKDFQKKMLPQTHEEITFNVTYDDYAKTLTPEGSFNVACLASVEQTNFEYFAQDDFRVRKPDIKFKIPNEEQIQVDQPFEVTVVLKNPLPVPLRKCSFTIEAPSLTEPIKIRLAETIKPGELASGKFELKPKLAGEKTITAKFNSRELQDVDGFVIGNKIMGKALFTSVVSVTICLTSMFWGITIAQQSSGILYPQESESRELKSLDGIWNFRLAPRLQPDLGFQQEWYSGKLVKTGAVDMMPVPSSYNDVTQLKEYRDHVGWAWYDRSFRVPQHWQDRRVFLRFGSAHYHSIVYVNGQKVVEHAGGALPFLAELNSELNFETENLITVAINNTLGSETIPQGKTVYQSNARYPDGYFTNDYNFDFFNYAGIHRSVFLYSTPKSYIDDIDISTRIDPNSGYGFVNYSIKTVENVLKSRSSTQAVGITVELEDKDGNVVGNGVGNDGEIGVRNVKLWWPFTMVENDDAAGYLYTLVVTAFDTATNEKDVYRLKVGIRQVRWTAKQFLINGNPFYFRGYGRHEDNDVRGKGFDNVLLVKDHNLIKWTGANSYRTSHYPYAEEIMDLADKLGIVIIDEVGAVAIDGYGPGLLVNHKQQMKELIQRDKNRASVVMWSVANEPLDLHPEAAGVYFKEVLDYTRELDSRNRRPVTLVCNIQTEYNLDKAAPYVDILSINRYFSWYYDVGHTETIRDSIVLDMENWARHHNKPVFLAEYGTDTIAGLHQSPEFVFTEEYQTVMMKEHFKAFDYLRANGSFIGEHIWNFADFMTAQGITRIVGNRKGIFTRQRQPKASAHLLRHRYHLLAAESDNYPIPQDVQENIPVYNPKKIIHDEH
ncbi:unnamed protein product [Allacma fusca]|uniref:protein-glutamine gamma-glutamyltransferase n=1 Tax=Allacma fusca TaxID=39272 RepID=A0A8J2JN95_9HEXA|nr:unnamed protein product [Allacma fusca]